MQLVFLLIPVSQKNCYKIFATPYGRKAFIIFETPFTSLESFITSSISGTSIANIDIGVFETPYGQKKSIHNIRATLYMVIGAL